MGLSIESARNKIINTYHIDVEKYASDEIIDEIQTNIENIIFFGVKILLPAAISGAVLLSVSVYFGIQHQSILLGAVCLLCVLPIWLGICFLSIIIAARSLTSAVIFITNYTVNVTRDIVVTINAADKETVKFSEISFLVLYGIVLPIIKKILRNRFFSGAIYFFVEKLVSMGTRKISADEDKKADNQPADSSALFPASNPLPASNPIPEADKGFLRINKKTYAKISKASGVAFTALSILGVILGGLCIVLGILFSVILIVMA